MKQKSLKLNFIMNAILTMSSVIFPLITVPYVSRVLLDVGTGKVTFATSIVTYFMMFAQLGIPTYGIRACANVRDDKEELSRVTHELFFISMVMTILSYILLAAAIIFVPRLREDKTLMIVTSFMIILGTIGVEWLYKGLEQYSYITIRSIIFKAISVIAMFFLVRAESDYVMYGAITVFASSASYVMNLINVRKYITLKPVGGYNLKRHFKPIAVFFAMACATTIYTNLDNVMLGFMKTDSDVGLYNAAVRVKTILVSLVTSLGTVLLPRASYYVEHGMMDEFKVIARKALNFVFLAAAPLALYFVIYAREGILLLMGDAFADSTAPMQIIMPTLLLIGITNILGIQILVPLGREKIVLYSEIAGAVVDVVINALLIPGMGASGAAIGTLVAEAVVLAVQAAALRKEVADAFSKICYWKILLAMVAAAAAGTSIKILNLPNFPALLLSALLFFGIYMLLLYATKERLFVEIMKQSLDKVKSKLKRS